MCKSYRKMKEPPNAFNENTLRERMRSREFKRFARVISTWGSSLRFARFIEHERIA